MDVNNIASLATAMANQRTGDAIGISVLKKALESQTTSAMALINALPQPQSGNPPHLGNRIDTSA
jgi:hypothetical protein